MPGERSLRSALDALLSVRGARGRDHRRALGRYGELLALEHLRARGFDLLIQGYRTRCGEIDLIVCDGCTLVFVEIKTVMREVAGPRIGESPLEWLSPSQLARYQAVAQSYLDDPRYAHPGAERMRFDAIGVVVDARGALVDLKHVEGGE